jgi:hypothetical protein
MTSPPGPPSSPPGLRTLGLIVAAAGPPLAFVAADLPAGADRQTAALALIGYEVVLFVAAFAAGVVGRLRERWITRSADAIDRFLLRVVSNEKGRYLRYLRAAYGHVSLQGLSIRPDTTLSLTETFVQPAVGGQTSHTMSPDPLRPPVGERGYTVWSYLLPAVRANLPLVVVGAPGSGKTTLLRHIAYALASPPAVALRLGVPTVFHSLARRRRRLKLFSRIPVLVVLRDHQARFTGDQPLPGLAEVVRESLAADGPDLPEAWVTRQLDRRRVLVLVDGLDELPDRESRRRATEWVSNLVTKHPGNAVVLTSRPFGYHENPLRSEILLQIQPFDRRQINAFLWRWYRATEARAHDGDAAASRLAAERGYRELRARLAENPKLAALTVNPLLLTMVAIVHRHRGALPQGRAGLYHEICNVFLGGRGQAKRQVLPLTTPQQRLLLQHLAFHMMERRLKAIEAADIVPVLRSVLRRIVPDMDVAGFLRFVEESSGLLLEENPGRYAFSHLTFQEYLAAGHVRETPSLRGLLLREATDPWWRETIALLAAEGDGTDLVLHLMDRGTRSTDRTEVVSALGLAASCVKEGREIGEAARVRQAEILGGDTAPDAGDARFRAGVMSLFRWGYAYRDTPHQSSVSPLVTNRQYQAFVELGDPRDVPLHWRRSWYPDGKADEPVVGVTRAAASRFCEWLNTVYSDGRGYRLPKAAEIDAAGDSVRRPVWLTEDDQEAWPATEGAPPAAVWPATERPLPVEVWHVIAMQDEQYERQWVRAVLPEENPEFKLRLRSITAGTDRLQSTRIVSLIDRSTRIVSLIDGEWLRVLDPDPASTVDALHQTLGRLRQLLDDDVVEEPGSDTQRQLMRLCDALGDASAEIKGAGAWRFGNPAAEQSLRRTRLLLLPTVGHCLDIADRARISPAPVPRQPRRRRQGTAGQRRRRSVPPLPGDDPPAHTIARDLVRTWVALVATEAVVDGLIPPYAGIRVARSAR